MTLTQIQYFLEVCETQNFTKAAMNLYVAQSSLSRQIRLLEEEIGIQLLVRDNRRVTLTEAGVVFKNEFQRISKDIDIALHKVFEAGALKKEIHVGLWAGFGPRVITEFMDRLNGYFPDYKIYIHKYDSDQLKKTFELGQTDIIINIDGSIYEERNVCVCMLKQLSACIVYSPKLFPDGKKPNNFTDFNGKSLVCVHDAMAKKVMEHQMDIIRKIGIKPSRYIEAENALFTLIYTEASEGFSVWYDELPEELNAYPVPEDLEGFSVFACWNKNTSLQLSDFFESCYGYRV